jgi:hypothetical protein
MLFNNGGNQPGYTDVQQAPGTADCWLVPSLAEVTARDPQAIEGRFTLVGATELGKQAVEVYSVPSFDNGGNAHY